MNAASSSMAFMACTRRSCRSAGSSSMRIAGGLLVEARVASPHRLCGERAPADAWFAHHLCLQRARVEGQAHRLTRAPVAERVAPARVAVEQSFAPMVESHELRAQR